MRKERECRIEILRQLLGGKIKLVIDGEDGYFAFLIEMPDGSEKDLYFYSNDRGDSPGSFEIIDWDKYSKCV